MKRISLIKFAPLGVLLLAAVPGALANTKCSTLVGPPTYKTSTPQHIVGDLDVDVAECALQGGGTVTGNVNVHPGNELDLEGNWVIGGNLTATNCTYILFNAGIIGSTVPYTTTIGGNVDIEGCTGGLGVFWVVETGTNGSIVMGNFTCSNNTGACFVQGMTIGGNVVLNNNVYPPPVEPPAPYPPYLNTSVARSTILGNLKCNNNSPSPLVGTGAVVLGTATGQCAGF